MSHTFPLTIFCYYSADDIFKCIMFIKNFMYFNSDRTGFWSPGNGMSLSRWQAITRTNNDPGQWPVNHQTSVSCKVGLKSTATKPWKFFSSPICFDFRLQRLSEEFYRCVNIEKLSEATQMPEEMVDFIYHYWILKRKVGYHERYREISNWYKTHQIPKLECFSSPHAVVFAPIHLSQVLSR